MLYNYSITEENLREDIMDSKVFCVVINESKKYMYTGKSDLSKLELGKLLKNVYDSNPVTIEIEGKTFTGVLSEICIVNDMLSNNTVKIKLI